MNIILINGKKRSGKDFVASLLQNELSKHGKTVEIMGFADPIKSIISTTLGVSLEKLDILKNIETPILVDENGKLNQIATARTVLQNFGTEAMQQWFGEPVWRELLLDRAINSKADFILVPDFRFRVEHISRFTIKIRNDDVEKNSTDKHRSENELNDFEFQYVINNTGYPDLTDQIQNLVKKFI